MTPTFINERILAHKTAFVWQTLLAIVFIATVLGILDAVSHTAASGIIGATYISASTFIVLGTSGANTACSRNVIGGYIVGLLVGLGCYCIADYLGLDQLMLSHAYLYELIGSITLGLTFIIMSLLNLQHPPAVGLSVGMVLDIWDPHSLIVIMGAVVALVIIKKALSKWLISFV